MISVTEALSIIDKNTQKLNRVLVSVVDANGFILAENIFAKYPQPLFTNSAMDGFAVSAQADVYEETSFQVVGEVKAGDDAQNINLQNGEAVRIFTGAMVPPKANTVIMQENIKLLDNDCIVTTGFTKLGSHVRQVGEQLKKNELVFPASFKLNEASIGLLAALGYSKVWVYKKPLVNIIVTGSELIESEQELTHGKIFESNSPMLFAALKKFGFNAVKIYKVPDNKQTIKKAINKALVNCDVLLLSGGVSVGDYDFVAQTLHEVGVKQHFHKVNQKPAKPLFFGTSSKNQPIFGIPGNPASALTCFYVYVLPVLNKLKGQIFEGLALHKVKAAHQIENKTQKTLFLKAILINNQIKILQGQQSHMLLDFAKANALAIIEPQQKIIAKNEFVNALIIN